MSATRLSNTPTSKRSILGALLDAFAPVEIPRSSGYRQLGAPVDRVDAVPSSRRPRQHRACIACGVILPDGVDAQRCQDCEPTAILVTEADLRERFPRAGLASGLIAVGDLLRAASAELLAIDACEPGAREAMRAVIERLQAELGRLA